MELRLQTRFRKHLGASISVATLVATITIAAVNLAATSPTKTVLITTHAIAEGDTLTREDVVELKIPIGKLADNYLTELSPKLTVIQSLSKGELIPKLAAVNQETQLIPVRLNGLSPISREVSVGDRVDIWATQLTQGSASTPEAVAFEAMVTAIETNNSMAQNTTSVELRISADYLETLLQAVDSNYKISVILHETLADIG